MTQDKKETTPNYRIEYDIKKGGYVIYKPITFPDGQPVVYTWEDIKKILNSLDKNHSDD